MLAAQKCSSKKYPICNLKPCFAEKTHNSCSVFHHPISINRYQRFARRYWNQENPAALTNFLVLAAFTINFKKIFRVKIFAAILIWRFFCLEQQIAVKIQIPSMDVELKLIYEKNSIEVNSKAYGYTRPKHSKVLDLMVRFIFRSPFILLCFKVLS